MDKINAWKAAVTALLGALTALWGWFGWLVVGWVGLMLLDYITGSAAAAKDGQWSSKEARAGIWHKAGMVVVVIVAVVGWVGLMLLDYITGSAAAAKDGQWSSKEARAGIWHKAGMVVVVIVAAGADMLLALILTNLPVIQLPVAYRGLVCPMVLVWYCITELGSIAENAVTMGAKVPTWPGLSHGTGLVLHHRAGLHRGKCRDHGGQGPHMAHQAPQGRPGRRGCRRGRFDGRQKAQRMSKRAPRERSRGAFCL